MTITEMSYKIFGSVLRDRLTEFAGRNGLMKEEQSGFCRGRQLEENLVILSLEIEKAKRRKGQLYVAGVDLRKAFDMVDRRFLVGYLTEVGFAEEWVGCISKIYAEERIVLYLGEENIGSIKRNRGIRQGCKASPLLFILCLNRVVDVINKIWKEERWNLLMYADDALIMAKTERELQEK